MILSLMDMGAFSYSQTDWVVANKGEAWRSVLPVFYQLDQDYQSRETAMLKNLQMYTMVHHTNVFSAFRMFDRQGLDPAIGSRLVWNIVRSGADTVAAKISKNRIKTMIVTDGADWLLQRKAERLDRAVYGTMYAGHFHKAAKTVFRDAELCGTGILQPVADIEGKKVCYERVLPFEVLVDEIDSLYGKPSRFYRWRLMGKGALKKKLPKKADVIDQLRTHSMLGGQRVSDAVLVFEAWYLDKAEGRHVIVAEGADLHDEKWDDSEPMLFFRWSDAPLGFWGTSLADELAPYQLEINKVLYFMQRAVQLGHAPKWFITPNSIPKGFLNNAIGTVVPVTGPDPRYFAPAPMHPQMIEYLLLLKNEAYAAAGISQLSARSEKPSGLNSGKALQTYNDIESERFVLVGQAYEDFHLQGFNATVRECRKIAEADSSFEVMSDSSFGFERINWNDVNLDDQYFLVKPYPISAFPQQPEARFAFLQEQLANGLITPEEFAELSDMPDIRTSQQMKYASYFAAKDNVERIMDGKEAISPEKYDKLSLALSVAVNSYLYSRQRGAPEDRLAALRDYIDEIQVMLPAPPPPEMPPAAPAAVPALPAPAPEGVPML
jgi:hypothetical protein